MKLLFLLLFTALFSCNEIERGDRDNYSRDTVFVGDTRALQTRDTLRELTKEEAQQHRFLIIMTDSGYFLKCPYDIPLQRSSRGEYEMFTSSDSAMRISYHIPYNSFKADFTKQGEIFVYRGFGRLMAGRLIK
jgi:hypothetical protein